MDMECPSCHALHWKAERLSNSSLANPKFGMCCFSGKIQLEPFATPPPELLALLKGSDSTSKNFRNDIRRYNDALAFTSVGRNLQNIPAGGGYCFKVQGKVSHCAGSLHPQEGAHPVYAQVYIYDPADGLNFRMTNNHNNGLSRDIMSLLQDMLYHHHPGVDIYKQANELTRDMPVESNCRIILRFEKESDQRCYNLPGENADIAILIPGSGDQPDGYRDIVIHLHGGGVLSINECNPMYMTLHYVLLFWNGMSGWHPELPFRNGEEFISQTEYYRYHLFPRANSENHLFYAGKLFHEFVVDSWAIAEQSRLRWILLNQVTLRADSYRGLMDAIAADPNVNGEQIGVRVILPSSFSGSTRNMIQNCQDALAINHHFKGADLFITATANP
ncbi:hypothetical protein FA15DRAFT_546240, partial [Coprinopsis marcescibilis]